MALLPAAAAGLRRPDGTVGLDLWDLAPTPAKAGRLRAAPIEKLLRQHRIRRTNADTVLRILQEPAIKVGKGVVEAASVHLRSLFTRLRVVNRELGRAGSQLDALCAAIGEIDANSGEGLQPRDVMILRSMPGIGRTNLATLLCEGSGPLSRRDYPALRTLWGRAGHQAQRQVAHRNERSDNGCNIPVFRCRDPRRAATVHARQRSDFRYRKYALDR